MPIFYRAKIAKLGNKCVMAYIYVQDLRNM